MNSRREKIASFKMLIAGIVMTLLGILTVVLHFISKVRFLGDQNLLYGVLFIVGGVLATGLGGVWLDRLTRVIRKRSWGSKRAFEGMPAAGYEPDTDDDIADALNKLNR